MGDFTDQKQKSSESRKTKFLDCFLLRGIRKKSQVFGLPTDFLSEGQKTAAGGGVKHIYFPFEYSLLFLVETNKIVRKY